MPDTTTDPRPAPPAPPVAAPPDAPQAATPSPAEPAPRITFSGPVVIPSLLVLGLLLLYCGFMPDSADRLFSSAQAWVVGHMDWFYAVSVTLRSEEHTSELQSPCNLVCRLLLEKKKKK